MRFIKRILLIISLLCISFGGNRYGTRIPMDHSSTYIGSTVPRPTVPYEFHSIPRKYINSQLSLRPNYLSFKIPGIQSEQQYCITDVRGDCENCSFYKKDFLELKIRNFTNMYLFKKVNGSLQKIDASKPNSLNIYMVKSGTENRITSYYCIVTQTASSRLGHTEYKSFRHFSKSVFENMMENLNYTISEDVLPHTSNSEINSDSIISQIKSRDSDLPISFRLAFSDGSETVIFNPEKNTFIKKPASEVFSHYSRSNSGVLTQEKSYYSFDSFALLNKSNPEIITLCKSDEMTTSDGQIIANKNLDLVFFSNTPHLIKEYGVPFARDYGFILFKPLHRIICWALDSIIIAFDYSSWSLLAFALVINLFMLPAVYYDALYKHNNKKVELRKELLKTKKSNDPVKYEGELAKLLQSQMPYFAKYVVAMLFEILVQISIMTCAIPFSYPMRFIKFWWFENIFNNEGYSFFNLYGLLKFTPPFFLKNVGALCVIVFLIMVDNAATDDKNNTYVAKIAIFLLSIFFFCKFSVAQIIVIIAIRTISRVVRYIFERQFEKTDITIS